MKAEARNYAHDLDDEPEQRHRRSRSLAALAGFGLLTFAAARFASRYTPGHSPGGWYEQLEKPPFTPPPVVFSIVWTSLYAVMAWSVWRVYSAPRSAERSRALRIWFTQLMTNAEWPKLFFGEHRPDLSLRDSIALGLQIAAYISAAGKVDSAAAKAFIPYLGWVGFATVLNAEIVRRNPELARRAA